MDTFEITAHADLIKPNKSRSRCKCCCLCVLASLVLIIAFIACGIFLKWPFDLRSVFDEWNPLSKQSDNTPSPTISPLPIPGTPYHIPGHNESYFTLNDSVIFIENDDSLKCIIKTDTNGNLLNTSYFELSETVLPNIEIGSMLLVSKYLYDQLPSDCTIFPAVTVWDITKSASMLTMFIKEANFWEYMPEMEVNIRNISLQDNRDDYIIVDDEETGELDNTIQKYNLTEFNSTTYFLSCVSIGEDGQRTESYPPDGLCGGSTIFDAFSGIYGADGFDTNVENHQRRRLLWGWFKKNVLKKVYNAVKKVVVVTIIEPVKLLIDIIRGDIDKRILELGIQLYPNFTYNISGKQEKDVKGLEVELNGEFEFEAGVNFTAVVYADLVAKYKIFTLNPSFDYFKFVVGAETTFKAYLNSIIKGSLSLKYEIIRAEKRKLFFLGPVPILVKLYGALETGLEAEIELKLSAEVGYKPIFIEFGVEYDPKKGGWNSVYNKNLALIPYRKMGGDLLGNSSCVEAKIEPYIQLSFGLVFYELIDVSLKFPYTLVAQFAWPSTCDSKPNCDYNPAQLKTTTAVNLDIKIGLKVGNDKLGLEALDEDWTIKTFEIQPEEDHCTDLALPMVIFLLCCPSIPKTLNPTLSPTNIPTKAPIPAVTKIPTQAPTKNPTSTQALTNNPTGSTTNNPTGVPTKRPTRAINNPTRAPTKNPIRAPTKNPIRAPTKNPIRAPTKNPTRAPTKNPIRSPTKNPTQVPTSGPSRAPTPAYPTEVYVKGYVSNTNYVFNNNYHNGKKVYYGTLPSNSHERYIFWAVNGWFIGDTLGSAGFFADCYEEVFHKCNQFAAPRPPTTTLHGFSVKYCVTADQSGEYFVNGTHNGEWVFHTEDRSRYIYHDQEWKISNKIGGAIIYASCNEDNIFKCTGTFRFTTCATTAQNPLPETTHE